jgi:hypothetical protein
MERNSWTKISSLNKHIRLSRVCMMARNGEVYFLIQVLKKGAHMNNNYPEHILKILREAEGLEDKTRDHLLQEMYPEAVLEAVLQNEGIIGYVYEILGWIEDIFKVKLRVDGEHQHIDDFKRGLVNILDAQNLPDDAVEQMAEVICQTILLER